MEELTPNPIFEMPTGLNIIKHPIKPSYTTSIAYPKFSLGFQHFIHQSLKKIHDEVVAFKDKKKVYDVYNNYSINIDEYSDSISEVGKEFFKKTNLSQEFYSYWELLCLFNLSCNKHEDLSNDDDISLAVDLFNKKYESNKNTLYTSINGREHDYVETQEQKMFKYLIEDINTVLSNGAKGCNFMLKINESYTSVTCKLLCLLSDVFDHVYLVKPLTVTHASSEKYVICINLKTNTNILNNIKSNLLDIFPTFEIEPDIMSFFIKLNTTFSNKQFQKINQMIGFIHRQNFRGEEYQERKKIQISSSEIWIGSFLLDKYKSFKEYIDACIQVSKNDRVTIYLR